MGGKNLLHYVTLGGRRTRRTAKAINGMEKKKKEKKKEGCTLEKNDFLAKGGTEYIWI